MAATRGGPQDEQAEYIQNLCAALEAPDSSNADIRTLLTKIRDLNVREPETNSLPLTVAIQQFCVNPERLYLLLERNPAISGKDLLELLTHVELFIEPKDVLFVKQVLQDYQKGKFKGHSRALYDELSQHSKFRSSLWEEQKQEITKQAAVIKNLKLEHEEATRQLANAKQQLLDQQELKQKIAKHEAEIAHLSKAHSQVSQQLAETQQYLEAARATLKVHHTKQLQNFRTSLKFKIIGVLSVYQALHRNEVEKGKSDMKQLMDQGIKALANHSFQNPKAQLIAGSILPFLYDKFSLHAEKNKKLEFKRVADFYAQFDGESIGILEELLKVTTKEISIAYKAQIVELTPASADLLAEHFSDIIVEFIAVNYQKDQEDKWVQFKNRDRDAKILGIYELIYQGIFTWNPTSHWFSILLEGRQTTQVHTVNKKQPWSLEGLVTRCSIRDHEGRLWKRGTNEGIYGFRTLLPGEQAKQKYKCIPEPIATRSPASAGSVHDLSSLLSSPAAANAQTKSTRRHSSSSPSAAGDSSIMGLFPLLTPLTGTASRAMFSSSPGPAEEAAGPLSPQSSVPSSPQPPSASPASAQKQAVKKSPPVTVVFRQ